MSAVIALTTAERAKLMAEGVISLMPARHSSPKAAQLCHHHSCWRDREDAAMFCSRHIETYRVRCTRYRAKNRAQALPLEGFRQAV